VSFRGLEITDLVASELRAKLSTEISPVFTFRCENAMTENGDEVITSQGP
jgi:hypothetical protein